MLDNVEIDLVPCVQTVFHQSIVNENQCQNLLLPSIDVDDIPSEIDFLDVNIDACNLEDIVLGLLDDDVFNESETSSTLVSFAPSSADVLPSPSDTLTHLLPLGLRILFRLLHLM